MANGPHQAQFCLVRHKPYKSVMKGDYNIKYPPPMPYIPPMPQPLDPPQTMRNQPLAITYVPPLPPLPPKVPSTSEYHSKFSYGGFCQGGAFPQSRRYNPNLNPFLQGKF